MPSCRWKTLKLNAFSKKCIFLERKGFLGFLSKGVHKLSDRFEDV
jgi:hypothetical protein